MSTGRSVECAVKIVELVGGEFPAVLLLGLPKPFMPGLDRNDHQVADARHIIVSGRRGGCLRLGRCLQASSQADSDRNGKQAHSGPMSPGRHGDAPFSVDKVSHAGFSSLDFEGTSCGAAF
jgi:hypothetical protein